MVELSDEHADCPRVMTDVWEKIKAAATNYMNLGPVRGTVIISTIRVKAPGLAESAMKCPHGVVYWFAPDATMQRWMSGQSDAS